MSLTGKAAANALLRGKISSLEVISTSAYELAVKNGFNGTLDEWLESLRCTDEQLTRVIDEYMNSHPKAILGEVTLYREKWLGSGNLFSQIAYIAGVTENSQVDLTPSVEQLAIFYEKDLTFVTENDGGVVTVYAIGQKPANDYTIQVTITEVSV